MKTIKSIIMISAAIAAVSCAKEINPETVTDNIVLQPMTFSAVSEDGIQTKAALEGKKIVWTSGDAISVFDGTGNRKFETTGSGSSVTFAGEADANASGFYALYPYQESATFHKEETQLNSSVTTANYISATVPSVQTATAGSFDPKAFFAVAKPNESGVFSFMNLLGLIQFRLADAANVASVTLSGHNAESLTGDMYIYFNDNGNATNTYGASTGKTVTLKGNFTADTDYYFTVRACSFEKGLTLSVEYRNGETITRKYISSSKRPTDKDGNNVTLSPSALMKLGTISNLKEGTPNDLYIAYEHGYDLTFGNQVINKATYGEAKLVTTKMSISTDDVHFIDPANKEATLTNPAAGEEGKVIIIGRYKDQRSTFSRTTSTYIRSTNKSDDLFLMANIDFNSTCSANYLFNNNNTDCMLENVIFDNCKLIMTTAKQFLQITSAKPIAHTQILNCDFTVNDGGAHTLIQLGANSVTDKIELVNNVFWNPTPEKATTAFQLITANKTAKLSNLILDKNTFVHTYTNGNGYVYVQVAEAISDATVTNNLFYLPDMASGYINIIDYNQTGTQYFKSNAAAIAADASAAIQTSPKLPDGQEQVKTKKGLNPFNGGTYDLKNGIFVPATDGGFDFSPFGAKR